MSAPKARLFCKLGELAGTELMVAGEATLGRDDDNTLVLASAAVSGHHARLSWDAAAGAYFLEDLGSRNGTEVDGLAVRAPERLDGLHVVTFAHRHDFIFQGPGVTAQGSAKGSVRRAAEEDPGEETEAAGSPLRPGDGTLAEKLWEPLPPALSTPDDPAEGPRAGTLADDSPLVLPDSLADPEPAAGPAAAAGGTLADSQAVPLPSVLAAAETPEASEPPKARPFCLQVGRWEYPLQDGENLVGRGPEAQVRLGNPAVSRRHAILHVEGETVRLEDLGSRNQTFVGVHPLHSKTVELVFGTDLRFGAVAARLARVGDPPPAAGMDDWEEQQP